MADPEAQVVNVNIDVATETLKLGIRRTVAFLGLGVNAALDPTFDKIHLAPEITNFQHLPNPMPHGALAEAKAEFRTWIQAAGFRELCETLETYFNQIYFFASLLSASEGGKIPSGTRVGPTKQFERAGLVEKLDMLRDENGVSPSRPDMLGSLWRARNCLGHRRGVVGNVDLAPGENWLRVSWLGLDAVVVEPDGKETVMGPGFEPFVLERGGEVHVRVVERAREFALGTRLDFSPHDLHEICWFALIQSDSIRKSLLELGDRKGVPLQEPPLASADAAGDNSAPSDGTAGDG